MFVRPYLPHSSGKTSARSAAAAVRAVLPVTALLAVCVGAHAESAGAILKRMVDTYNGASAYTATLITYSKGKAKNGKPFTLTKTQAIKFKAPNMINSVVSFSGEGEAAGKVAQGNQTVVADGKIMTAYWPSRKQYVKKPDPAKVTLPDLIDILKRIPTRDAPNVKMLAADTVGGRPVNVIEIAPMMPPNLTVEKQKQWQDVAAKMKPWRFFIDKQNYSLLKIAESANGGSVDFMLQNQLFNSSIPAAAFAYSPPAGAKEMKAPPTASLGGTPAVKPGTIPPPPVHR